MNDVSEKINITVPVYKVKPYLARCVDSLLHQSYTNFELVLVDDGSPDECGTLIDDYASRDARVIAIHQRNGGLSAARNTGIELSLQIGDCQWITFVDSDDWVEKDYLERLYHACKSNAVDAAACGYYETYGEIHQSSGGEVNSIVISPENFWCCCRGEQKTQNDHYMVSPTVAWGKLYKIDGFNRIRYPAGKLHEDEYTTYKLLFALDRVALVPSGLLYYFQNPQSIVGAKWNLKRLDCVEALAGQTDFFRKNGFWLAYGFARRALYDNLIYSIHQLQKAGYHSKYRKYRFYFKFRLLKDFRYNHPFPSFEVYYEFAFPVLLKVFFYGRSAMNKFKRLFRRRIVDETKKQ